jgi:hypothetical protein
MARSYNRALTGGGYVIDFTVGQCFGKPQASVWANCHFAVHLSLLGRKLSPRAFVASYEEGVPLLRRPMTASHALSRRIREEGYQTLRAQIAACLLCLVIVGASLDGLPDPPAVKPQGNLKTLVSQLHSHVPFAAKNNASDCPASAPHYQARLFSFGQIFEGRGPSYDPTFVHQATDTSPPSFA